MKRKRYLLVIFPALLFGALLFTFGGCRNSGPGLPGGVSITFVDTDMGSGELGGTVTVNRALDENRITHYVLYWGQEGNLKVEGLPAIGEVAVSEADIVIEIPENTVIPAGATHILAFVKAGEEESTESGSAAIVDLGSTVTVTLNHSLSDVGSFSISVSGEDMEPVSDSGDAAATQIVVEVPDGTDRTFEVTAYISSSSNSAALAYAGSTVTDLTAGQAASVSVAVDQLSETKIVIPDPGNSNYRLVQVSDMDGGGWTEMIFSDISWTNDYFFRPFDVDFDNQGRIYIANNTVSGSHGRVVRVDNITGANIYEYTDVGSNIGSLAVDRNNGMIYYADSNTLWESTLSGSGNTDITPGSITSFSGLAVDGNGKLFIAGGDGSGNVLFRYNPATDSVEKSYGNGDANIGTAWDVLVLNDSVYLANYNGADGYLIMQFDFDLNFVAGFGDESSTPGDPADKDFLGPRRFVAILNKKLTLIDEHDTLADDERIVQFTDMSGTSWDSFDPSDVGESAFGFFEEY